MTKNNPPEYTMREYTAAMAYHPDEHEIRRARERGDLPTPPHDPLARINLFWRWVGVLFSMIVCVVTAVGVRQCAHYVVEWFIYGS
jgi:hypothetical protein